MSKTLERLLQKTGCETEEELAKFSRRFQLYIAKTINADVNEMINDLVNADQISPALDIILKDQSIDSNWIVTGESKSDGELKRCLKSCPLQRNLFDLLIQSSDCEALCEKKIAFHRLDID